MKKPYKSPEILKLSVDLQDILTTSNELDPDIKDIDPRDIILT